MDYNNLVKRLRGTPSRSKRELLDKAADVIEELEQELHTLTRHPEVELEPILLRLDEEGLELADWEKPFMTIECPTEDDYKGFQKLIELGNKFCWISVEDRLPEPFVSVLGYCPDEDPLPTVHEVYMNGFGQWTSAQVYGMGNVTHWMAMPEAPES